MIKETLNIVYWPLTAKLEMINKIAAATSHLTKLTGPTTMVMSKSPCSELSRLQHPLHMTRTLLHSLQGLDVYQYQCCNKYSYYFNTAMNIKLIINI